MCEPQRFDGDAVAGFFVELLEVLVLAAMAAVGDPLDDDESARKKAVKPTPQMVAVFLVSRLMQAVLSRIRKTAKMPMGRSICPCLVCYVTFSGTRYWRGERSLNRSTAIASVMKTNDQMTPNA